MNSKQRDWVATPGLHSSCFRVLRKGVLGSTSTAPMRRKRTWRKRRRRDRREGHVDWPFQPAVQIPHPRVATRRQPRPAPAAYRELKVVHELEQVAAHVPDKCHGGHGVERLDLGHVLGPLAAHDEEGRGALQQPPGQCISMFAGIRSRRGKCAVLGPLADSPMGWVRAWPKPVCHVTWEWPT